MPNQRADNQTLIAFALNRKLLVAVDHACTLSDEDRSTFIRQSLVNFIRSRRGVVQEEWVSAQERARGARRYEPAGAAPAARPARGRAKAKVKVVTRSKK